MFTGREAEKEEILRAFEETRNGHGKIVLVAGESGIGKTSLAREVLGRSRFIRFYGRAVPEARSPYGLMIAALRDGLSRVSDKAISNNPLRDHLAVLLPETGNPTEEKSGDSIKEAVVATLVEASREGLIALYLEDIHWADSATLELLPYLAERFTRERIMILATYRNDEISRDHPIRLLRNDLRRARRFNEIILQPLDIDSTAGIIETILGEKPSEKLAGTLHIQSQGIPLFVEELAHSLKNGEFLHSGENGLEISERDRIPLPESIRDAILLRLEGLSVSARNQLEAAAVLGTEFDFDLLVELSGSEDGLEELFAKNLINETSRNRGQFRHSLIRESVKAEITWTRRRSLHRLAGEYLERRGAPPDAIAEHWLACNETVRARVSLMQSAQNSCGMHAFRDAANAANRALEIWPASEDTSRRLSLLENFGHCAKVSGQLTEAARAYKELAESETIRQDNLRFGEVMRSLATVYALQGAWKNSMQARREAAEAFTGIQLFDQAALEWYAVASRECASLRLKGANEAIEKSLEMARKSERKDLEARALALRGYIRSIAADYDEGMNSAREGLSLALSINDIDAASDAYRRMAGVLEYSSHYTSSREAYTTAINFCQSNNVDFQKKLCMGCMAWVVFRLGDWNRALEICRDVVEDDNPPDGTYEFTIGLTGLIKALRGEVKSAEKLLRQSIEISLKAEYAVFLLILPWGEAIIREIEGNERAAGELYAEILGRWHGLEDCHDILPPACAAATFFARTGDTEKLAECTNIISEIAGRTGLNEAMAILAHALGENAMMQKNYPEAADKFAQASEQFERMELPLERSRSLYRLGMALVKAGQRREGLREMETAQNLAKKLGCRPLGSEIGNALRQSGFSDKTERKRTPEDPQNGNLTRRQKEIVGLLIAGMTNKEIAERLYLSPRTVDMHVSNILERLNCRSRTEAARKAHELGFAVDSN